jgi:hypothetical protein
VYNSVFVWAYSVFEGPSTLIGENRADPLLGLTANLNRYLQRRAILTKHNRIRVSALPQ